MLQSNKQNAQCQQHLRLTAVTMHHGDEDVSFEAEEGNLSERRSPVMEALLISS